VRQIFPVSSIRTVTVGFGISSNLLTPPIARRALAGFDDRSPLPPVGIFKFEYRFNRRYDLAAMMPRLGYVAVRTPPMPYRLLKLAEDHA
jgi:hypothetical protein